jgi:hypothetical protein
VLTEVLTAAGFGKPTLLVCVCLLRVELKLGGSVIGLFNLAVYAGHFDLAEGLDEGASFVALVAAGG